LKNKEKKNSFEQREQFKLTKIFKLYFYRTLNVVQKIAEVIVWVCV